MGWKIWKNLTLYENKAKGDLDFNNWNNWESETVFIIYEVEERIVKNIIVRDVLYNFLEKITSFNFHCIKLKQSLDNSDTLKYSTIWIIQILYLDSINNSRKWFCRLNKD